MSLDRLLTSIDVVVRQVSFSTPQGEVPVVQNMKILELTMVPRHAAEGSQKRSHRVDAS